MDLELRHLKVVCAIADAGSVTKAATVLGLPQPALTTQLRRIERVFGAALFERDQKGARPTPLGELVLERARVLLPAVRGLRDEAVRFAANDLDGRLETNHHRIGAVHGPLLAGLVHRLATDEPQARITTHAAWSVAELDEMVGDGRLDYALIGTCGDSPPPAERGLHWQEVAVDPVFVLLSVKHKLAEAAEADLRDFADEMWSATRGDDRCFDDCFVVACARAGFTPKPLYETDVTACLELVEAGDAIGLGQGGFRRTKAVTAVPLNGNPLRWRHWLGWHPESTAALFSEQVLKHARDSYVAAVERSPRYADWLAEHPQFGVAGLHPISPLR